MTVTKQQEAAIASRAKRICVAAGAGSGKTQVLVKRITHLITQGEARLEDIVAITFTDKAAAEMKERLRNAFHTIAPTNDSTAMTHWRDLERRADTARVCTIHAFCTALLKENAFRLGLDPDFAVLPEADTILLLDEAVSGTLHTLFEQDDPAAVRLGIEAGFSELKKTLTKLLRRGALMGRIGAAWPLTEPAALCAAWEAVLERERERHLRALAHSGKAASYLHQLRQYDGMCEDPGEAREQWRRRAIEALDNILKADSSQDIEHCLHKIVEKQGGRANRAPWNSGEAFDALDKWKKKLEGFVKGYLEPPSVDAALEGAAAQLACDLFGVYQQAEIAFAQLKARRNSMDFDDLIAHTHKALHNDPELRRRVASDIRFLLIDEFQDTDGIQLDIAKLMADEPGGPDLFIVGDAKQSIYLFRGAEVEVFQEQRGRSDIVLPLSRNFRSLPDVLGFVNDLFTRSGLLGAIEPYAPMETDRAALDAPRIEFVITDAEERGAEKEQNTEAYRQAEAERIAARIQAMCGGDDPVSLFDGVFRPAAYGDVALLFRALSNVHLYEEALRRAGIPYALTSGSGFYAKQEIRDVLNALKVFLDPWDETALLAFLRGPMGGLSDESILRLCQPQGLTAVFEGDAIPEDFAQETRLQAARALVRRFRPRTGHSPAVVLRELLDISGFEAVLLPQYLGLQKASNVRKLLELAEAFRGSSGGGLRAFVHYAGEIGDHIRENEATLQPEGGGAVTLMTIHKSKGLEFPIVIVPDMAAQRRGSNNESFFLHRDLGVAMKVTGADGTREKPAIAHAIAARIADEEEAEHARLLYVALTRARDYLVMCGTDNPKSGSWFETLDGAFGILGKPDGGHIKGKGWSGRILRGTRGELLYRAGLTQETPPDLDTLRRMVAPVPASDTARNVFSISAILDYWAGGFDMEEEHAGGEDKPRVSGAALAAMARGSLVHRLFEEWDFTQDRLPDLDALVSEAGIGLRRRAEMIADLRRIAERFRNSELWPRAATAASIQKEAPFLLRAGDALISGTIDALLPGGVIIDYKTGHFHDARHARYEWQLLLYAGAVRTLLPCTPTAAFLYYADEGICREVALSGEQLAWALRHAQEAIAALRAG